MPRKKPEAPDAQAALDNEDAPPVKPDDPLAEIQRNVVDGLMATVRLDAEAGANIAIICGAVMRRNGFMPSRGQVIRAALKAYADAVK
jgi:hypothetical protein